VTESELSERLAKLEGRKSIRDQLRPAAEYLGSMRDFQNTGRHRAVPWGIQFLEDSLGHLYGTDLAVIIGDTGSGKTTATRLVVDGALSQGKRVAWFMLESHDGEGQHRQVYEVVRRLAWAGSVRGIEAMTFGRWANGLCSSEIHELDTQAVHEVGAKTEGLLMRYRGNRFTAKDIDAEFRAIGSEVDLLVLDHLHYVDDEGDQTETRALTEVAKTLRNVALDIGRPVLAVAHVRKRGAGSAASALLPSVEDIHGSSNVPKITTRVISLAPAYDRKAPSSDYALTYVRVAKDRWDGAHHLAACLQFDRNAGRYRNEYILGRFDFSGQKFAELTQDELPQWCSCPDEHALPQWNEEDK
jgi:replicative DNA helicase